MRPRDLFILLLHPFGSLIWEETILLEMAYLRELQIDILLAAASTPGARSAACYRAHIEFHSFLDVRVEAIFYHVFWTVIQVL